MEEFLIVIQAVVGSSPTNHPILSIKHPKLDVLFLWFAVALFKIINI